jgi:hypothetical protein
MQVPQMMGGFPITVGDGHVELLDDGIGESNCARP